MRVLPILLALVLGAGAANGQILAIILKDEKLAKKYSDNLMPFNGQMALVGEIKSGIWLENRQFKWAANGNAEIYIADPENPAALPYKLKGEEKIPAGSKGVVKLSRNDVQDMGVLIDHQSLFGLAEEYKERLAKIDAATKERDGSAKGGREWVEAHQQVMSHYERLQSWLASTAFPPAAKKLAKEIERQRKVVAAEAMKARVTAAKDAIHAVETPTDLIATSQQITNGTAVFKVMESLHVRIVYLEQIGDERIRRALEFAEEVIDAFRGDCVDPYVGADYEDKIPDRLFAEYWFGPEDKDQYERFWVEYYRQKWGDHKEESLALEGTRGIRFVPPERILYSKYTDKIDLHGILAHDLGHNLADVQYNQALNRNTTQDWIQEGVGFYLSLEFLGRNDVTCKSFLTEPTKYAHERKKAGQVSAQLGLRDFYNALALDEGLPIESLAMKTLFEFGDADMAKSWSFYEFLVKQEGKQGQLFLQAACEFAKDKKTFVKNWREKANSIYDVKGKDVFDLLEKRWREYAETGQETGDVRRSR